MELAIAVSFGNEGAEHPLVPSAKIDNDDPPPPSPVCSRYSAGPAVGFGFGRTAKFTFW